jgi:hypothetical protein
MSIMMTMAQWDLFKKRYRENLQKITEMMEEKKRMEKFWMVLGDGRPTFRHTYENSANQEAERLARANPGREFIVLEAKRIFKVENPVKRIELSVRSESVPF